MGRNYIQDRPKSGLDLRWLGPWTLLSPTLTEIFFSLHVQRRCHFYHPAICWSSLCILVILAVTLMKMMKWVTLKQRIFIFNSSKTPPNDNYKTQRREKAIISLPMINACPLWETKLEREREREWGGGKALLQKREKGPCEREEGDNQPILAMGAPNSDQRKPAGLLQGFSPTSPTRIHWNSRKRTGTN